MPGFWLLPYKMLFLPDLDFEDLLTVHIQVSPETAEALRQPEQFAESEAA